MKKMFKKNQVIITALAIMIAVAGYLNFTEEKTDMALANLEGELTYADMENSLLDLSEEDLDVEVEEEEE